MSDSDERRRRKERGLAGESHRPVQSDKVLASQKGVPVTHRRIPHWVAMARWLAEGCPRDSWAKLKYLVDPEDSAARDDKLTALLIADQ